MCHEKATLPGHLAEPNANGREGVSGKEVINPSAFALQMVRMHNSNETLSIHLQEKSLGDNSANHDTVSTVLRVLTRTIGVICSSQYLQSNRDRVQTLKLSNNLITISLYRDRQTARARDGKYCAVPVLLPGLTPG